MSRLLEQAREAQEMIAKLEARCTTFLPEGDVAPEIVMVALARVQQEIDTVLAAHRGNRFLHQATSALLVRWRQRWTERFQEHRWDWDIWNPAPADAGHHAPQTDRPVEAFPSVMTKGR
jgi:hypothetical protein